MRTVVLLRFASIAIILAALIVMFRGDSELAWTMICAAWLIAILAKLETLR